MSYNYYNPYGFTSYQSQIRQPRTTSSPVSRPRYVMNQFGDGYSQPYSRPNMQTRPRQMPSPTETYTTSPTYVSESVVLPASESGSKGKSALGVTSDSGRRRVGIVGYGNVGKFLCERISESDDLELAFVWNRTREKIGSEIPAECVCEDLDNFAAYNAHLIVEVAHPSITHKYVPLFLEHADVMLGSPTALADAEVEAAVCGAATKHGVYVAAGAFWGAEDIRKMADRGTLKKLTITMKKHPSSFKVTEELQDAVDNATEETVLYEGPVRGLCPLAPNNVNTMACGALAAHNLGFDGVNAVLIADPSLEAHVIEIDAEGPSKDGDTFRVFTRRHNPAKPGAVTGSATYVSFFSSMIAANGRGAGTHIC